MQSQPVPSVDEHDVDRVVARDYSADEAAEVRRQFARLGLESGPRVRLAILKLAAGDLERLADHIEVANTDWRDVIAAAEYPSAFRLPFSAPAGARQSAYDADWEQYQAWLGR